jgi:hypothetical protein
MLTNTVQGAHEALQPEALSSETLKLKMDDLFQDVESLKQRVARLEGLVITSTTLAPEASPPNACGVVSNPDGGK